MCSIIKYNFEIGEPKYNLNIEIYVNGKEPLKKTRIDKLQLK